MSLSQELAYEGAHFAHIAAYREHQRLVAIERRNRDAITRRPTLRPRWAA